MLVRYFRNTRDTGQIPWSSIQPWTLAAPGREICIAVGGTWRSCSLPEATARCIAVEPRVCRMFRQASGVLGRARMRGEEGGWMEGRSCVTRGGTNPVDDGHLKRIGRRAVRDRVEQRPAVGLGGTRPSYNW